MSWCLEMGQIQPKQPSLVQRLFGVPSNSGLQLQLTQAQYYNQQPSWEPQSLSVGGSLSPPHQHPSAIRAKPSIASESVSRPLPPVPASAWSIGISPDLLHVTIPLGSRSVPLPCPRHIVVRDHLYISCWSIRLSQAAYIPSGPWCLTLIEYCGTYPLTTDCASLYTVHGHFSIASLGPTGIVSLGGSPLAVAWRKNLASLKPNTSLMWLWHIC